MKAWLRLGNAALASDDNDVPKCSPNVRFRILSSSRMASSSRVCARSRKTRQPASERNHRRHVLRVATRQRGERKVESYVDIGASLVATRRFSGVCSLRRPRNSGDQWLRTASTVRRASHRRQPSPTLSAARSVDLCLFSLARPSRELRSPHCIGGIDTI